MSNNAHELSNRLVNALDNNYNVVDMHTVNEIISILEKFNITKELLETTRLGKHVNELRRKTSDPTLARRAKVLVKRWRDLVIPTVASPGHSGNLSNRSSAERSTVRRLGGTPLTSPALTRQVVSPAVHSPRPPSRPAWGGYESDSQDVILVDDDPPPAPPPPPPPPPPAPPATLHNAHKPLTPPVKRPPSPQPLHDDKKAKRDKKPKRKRGHSRAGSGTESAAGEVGAVGAVGEVGGAGDAHTWRDRNGSSQLHRKRNGCRKSPLDPYTALVNRMPKAGDKKVKTTKELLEQIQMRGACAPSPSPCPPAPSSPHSPDVMFIEPDSYPTKVESPLRNGTSPAPPPSTPPAPLPPLEDEREYHECTCGDAPQETCRAARRTEVTPLHVAALHHAYLPGINGTRAPLHPHRFAVRDPVDPDRPGLFTAVVPLYKYSDYADDRCAKNMFRVPICRRLPWTEFAPDPPAPPPPPSPPPPRPYPVDETPAEDAPLEIKKEVDDDDEDDAPTTIEAETVGVPVLEPSERLKAPILSPDEDAPRGMNEAPVKMEVEDAFETKHQDHRTVERTKEETNGQMLFDLVRRAADGIPYDYDQMFTAPVVTLPDDEYRATETLEEALLKAEEDTTRDELGRPNRPENFSEWHECARLGELIALPYVVID